MSTRSKEEAPLIQSFEANNINEIVNRIGFGRYQILLGIGLCILGFSDGAIITAITIISYILESSWDLSTLELGVLGGSSLLGMSLGYLLSPVFESRMGRIRTLYISLSSMIVLGLSISLMNNLWLLSTTYFFQGCALTIGTPPSFALAVEFCPAKFRGPFILMIELSFGFGQIFIIFLSLLLTPDLNSENWRVTVIISTLMIVPSLTILVIYGSDSPIFLARKREYEKAIGVLNKVASMNQTQGVNEGEEDQVFSTLPSYIKNAGSRSLMLFDRWHFALTIKVLLLASVCTVAYFGIITSLPFILEFDDAEGKDILLGLLVIYSCQIPCVLAFIFLVEIPLFGRKNSIIIISTLICILMMLIVGISNENFTYYTLLFAVSLANVIFSLNYLYIPEVYETELRVVAIGIANVTARFVGSLSLQVFYLMIDSNDAIAYLFIAFLFGFLIFIGFSLPYDTTGKNLDTGN